VANFLDDTVTVHDAVSLKLVTTLETDPYPHGLDISADGKWIVATGYSSDHVRIINGETFSETARVNIGAGSSHSTFMPDNKSAWTACSVDDHIAKIDLATGKNVFTARIS
jgi:DNA-binding beta-propeller fold protein YncE